MKRMIALGVAKIATWLMHFLIGWIKGETPEYALAMRRRSKAKIFAAKAKAIATASEADDIPPLAAESYMGFETMQRAQREMAEIYRILDLLDSPTPTSSAEGRLAIRRYVTAAIRILDEAEV